MGNAHTIKDISDNELIAELQRRASESPHLRRQASEALTEEKVRPDLKRALAGSGESVPEDTEKRELSPEESAAFLASLETRLASKPECYKRPKGIKFSEVKDALEGRPDLMWSLAQMENSGGDVDIRAIEGNEFVFCDFAQETPKDRRDLNYYQVAEKAKEMGVDIQSEAGWRALQKLGKFDLETWIWVKSDDIIDTGLARRADRYGVLRVNRLNADSHHMLRGWRAELRVKKNLTSVDGRCPAIHLLKALGLD